MSLDLTQMEVLRRSGTEAEQKYARRITPLLQNQHWLLVTLLLCNAGGSPKCSAQHACPPAWRCFTQTYEWGPGAPPSTHRVQL